MARSFPLLDRAEALRSDSDFWKAMDSLPVAVYACRQDGIIAGYNDKAVELWGRRPKANDSDERFCGAKRLLYPSGKQMPHAESPMARVLQSGLPVANGTAVIERPDGDFITVQVNISPLFADDGSIAGAINCFHEIESEATAEARVEALSVDLRRRISELETILHLAPIGIGIAEDPQCKDIRVNQAFARLLGVEPGANASKTAPAEERQAFKVLRDGLEVPGEDLPMQQAARTGEPVGEVEMEVVREDGSRGFLLGFAAPLLNEAAEPRGAIGVFMDITERKYRERTEMFLAEATRLLAGSLEYETTLENIARLAVPRIADWCAVDILDDTGELKRLAVAHEDPRKAEVARRLADRFQRARASAERGPLSAIRNRSTQYMRDVPDELLVEAAADEEHLRLLRAVGLRSYICVPLVARDETPLGAITLVNADSGRPFEEADVLVAEELARRASVAIEHARLFREAHETAADLARASAVKDEFLGLVSHELKTPITTILGNAAVLNRRPDIPQHLRAQALDDIEHEADRLHRIVNNLLVLARLEQGRQLDLEPLLLERLAGSLAENHRKNHPWRDLRIEVVGKPSPVLADTSYMEQVVLNLLGNAEKYSPQDRPITVRVEGDAKTTRLSVLDEGPGVPSEDTEHIFTPFYRSPATANIPGVGIGLAVCLRLVEAQDGRIWVEPRKLKGAKFTVELPAVTDRG